MLEMDGLQYISTARPPNAKGVSYGGAAIVVNKSKFTCERLKISIVLNNSMIHKVDNDSEKGLLETSLETSSL